MKQHTAGSTSRPRLLHPAGWLIAFAISLAVTWFAEGRQQADDFASLWIAGELTRAGLAEHIYDYSPYDFAAWSGPAWQIMLPTVADVAPFPHPYVHLPLIAWLFSGAAAITTSVVALRVLTFCNCLAAFVIIAAAARLWTRQRLATWKLLLASILLLASPLFVESLWIGQTTPLILGGTLAALALAEARPWLAGILLGIVASIKLTPLALVGVLLLWKRTRRAAFIAMVTSLVLLIAAWASMGVGALVRWGYRLREISESVLVGVPNRSLIASLLLRDHAPTQGIFTVLPAEQVDASLQWQVRGLMAVVALLLALAAYQHPRKRYALVCSTVVVGYTVFSSIAWSHYFIVAILPLFGLATYQGRGRILARFGAITGAAALLSPFTGLALWDPNPWFQPAVPLIATLALLLVLLGLSASSLDRPVPRHRKHGIAPRRAHRRARAGSHAH